MERPDAGAAPAQHLRLVAVLVAAIGSCGEARHRGPADGSRGGQDGSGQEVVPDAVSDSASGEAKDGAAVDAAKEIPAPVDPCFSDCILAVTRACTPDSGCLRSPSAAKTEEATCFDNGVKAYTIIGSKGAGASFVTTFRAASGPADCYSTTYVVDGGSTLEMRDAAGVVFATGKSSGTGLIVTCGGKASSINLTNPSCSQRIYGGVFGGCLPDDKGECAYP